MDLDPLSITTGLAGLLGTAATVINFLDTAKTTIRDASKTFAWALAEVNDIYAVVSRLRDYFEHLDSIPKDARDLVTIQHASVTVSELVASFDDLVDALKPFGLMDPSLMRTWDKLKWARKQDDVTQIITRIQVRKSSLILMLNIFKCESDVLAMKSRSALENTMNTVIKSNIDIQKRLDRMERLFEAYIDNAPAGKMLGYDDTHSDAMSVRPARGMVPQVKRALALPEPQRPPTVGFTQDADGMLVIQREFEETLDKSGVYQCVQRPSGPFSIHSGDDGSVTRTIKKTHALAENASILPSRFLGSLVHRRRKASDTRGSPQMPVPQKKYRTPPNCGPDVMGAWSVYTRRTWRPTEFRLETLFEVPVIFVCRPSNRHGPVKDKPIHFVSGTQESLAATRTLLPREEEDLRQSMEKNPRHTPDSERASWLRLLSQLQSMEKESREWQRHHYRSGPPMRAPCVEFSNHTLTAAVQAEKRSWDSLPNTVKKPYATTTICDLLEIAAMMGLYWKEFDRSKDRYQAEGNGYMLTGTRIPDLGVIFTFQIYGKARFLENRVIPVDEVKELCCGVVPTLFHEADEERRRIQDPIQDLSFLQLGSTHEIADTMMLLGCNTDTANRFRSNAGKQSHLFPVLFEIVGMLGKTLHIRNSAFRMLPNPTPYRWDSNFANLPKLVQEYSKMIATSDWGLPRGQQLHQLKEDANFLVQALAQDMGTMTPGYSMPLLNTLHDVLDRCDAFLQQSDQNIVRIVAREHFQAVLKLINEEEGEATSRGYQSGVRPQRAEHFGQLTAASPELCQQVFMELYFSQVLSQVKERAATSYARQQAMRQPPTPSSRRSTPSPTRQEDHASRRSSPVPDSGGGSLEPQVSAIWCTLVLRMMCWLLLHDFDKRDVQIPKSELLGSRLPVYIA